MQAYALYPARLAAHPIHNLHIRVTLTKVLTYVPGFCLFQLGPRGVVLSPKLRAVQTFMSVAVTEE